MATVRQGSGGSGRRRFLGHVVVATTAPELWRPEDVGPPSKQDVEEREEAERLRVAAGEGDAARVGRMLWTAGKRAGEVASALTGLMGRGPMHEAAEGGHIAVMERLIAHRADPNARDEGGATALHWASDSGGLAAVKWLLDRKALPHITDSYEDSPLHWASAKGHADVARLLLASGAAADNPNKAGWTPLHMASANGHATTARLLMDRGASVRSGNCDGNTALHLACASGRINVVELLLARGADTNLLNAEGKTCVDMTRNEGVLYTLSEHGVINTKGQQQPLSPKRAAALARVESGGGKVPRSPKAGAGGNPRSPTSPIGRGQPARKKEPATSRIDTPGGERAVRVMQETLLAEPWEHIHPSNEVKGW